jgi:hypothetical protein
MCAPTDTDGTSRKDTMKTPVNGAAGRQSSAFVYEDLAEAPESHVAPYERPGFLHARAVLGREDRSDLSFARGAARNHRPPRRHRWGQLSSSV